MADDIFLLDSPAIEKAVMAHNTEVTLRRRFGKSSLNEIPEVSGGSGEGYDGQFAIRNTGTRTFEVYWPGTEYAGDTDLPGVGYIPVQTVTLPEERTLDSIMLYACCNDGVYSAVIRLRSLDVPQGYFDYVELGTIYAEGKVRQIYKDNTGTGMEFGRRWFL